MMMLNETQLKASVVLQAMVTGLLKSKDDPNFTVKMETFGEVENKLCYGCCATLTLAEMFGKGRSASEMMLGHVNTRLDESDDDYAYLPDVYLSDVIKSDPSIPQDPLPVDLVEFEFAVDSARTGKVSLLIGYLTGEFNNESFDRRWILDSNDWEEQLPKIEATIAEMIAAGY